MKKIIHIPTLLVHAVLLLTATQTMNHYPDIILWVGGIGLTSLLIYSIRSVMKGGSPLLIFRTHLLGCIIQSTVLHRPEFVFSGLGYGFAHFFYQAGLVISLILLALGLFLAFALRKPSSD